MRGGEYILKLNNLSEKERGYLFGLFKGDGYSLYNPKDRHYHVEFYLNSKTNKDIIKFLCKLLKKINTNPLLRKDRRFECVRIRVNSKNFYKMINEEFITYLKNYDFALGFVSGFLDAEGHVNSLKKVIRITNTNLEILNLISNFLNKIEIHNKISLRKKSAKDKKKIYSMYISVKFKSLPHLSIKAGKH